MAKSYKDTMNLPKTKFPMRGNLPTNEPKRLEKWQEMDLYHKILDKNKDGKPFILHDGPPYANGSIHLGHAFNKVLKDFVVKSKAQNGYYTPFIPGWDCHGQPIEHMVEEKLGPEKMSKIDKPTLRKICKKTALKYVDIQREGFKRLGINADWDNPYLTVHHNYESGNVEIFKKMYMDGAIYKGSKPIHWCKHCHTALAEAEIEYSDESSPSIFVNFKMDKVPDAFSDLDDLHILIWTTTPWTLPANTAVSLAPEADYCVVTANDKNMLFAIDLLDSVAEAAGWDTYKVYGGNDPVLIKGKDLEGYTYTCPIREDLKGKIIWGNHVTLDSGTGAVHTAPGHGVDDYLVGQKFGIATLMPVDDNGVLTKEAGPFAGLDTDESNPKIIEWLDERGVLVAQKNIDHSYPHCWRCHKPVIFRATDQWFVSLDKTDLRKDSLNAIKNDVRFVPDWAKNRIGAMVSDRPDWCISRQRNWGVPIPVFRCKKCGQLLANEQSFDAVINLFEEHGADVWYKDDLFDYLPNLKCENCDSDQLQPESDILDVWWESGCSHTSVCIHRKNDGMRFPADMYLEGSDQHRGWFQSSLLTSIGAYDIAPYKQVVHCGFIVDGNGHKMSKSLGNVVDPTDVIKKFGADVLRLWVASVDYSLDVGIDKEIMQRIAEAYRHIRNAFRNLLGNLYDFNPDKDAVKDFNELRPVDRWMMGVLYNLLFEVTNCYNDYNFHGIYRAIYNFINNELSSIYMDVTKDRLYSDAADSLNRRSAQTVYMNILNVMCRFLAPILSFTCDEVWQYFPERCLEASERPESVQLAGWPTLSDFIPDVCEKDIKASVEDFDCALTVREAVKKELEKSREDKFINKSQEASVEIHADSAMAKKLNNIGADNIAELLIVSEVLIFDDASEIKVKINKAKGNKCPRCWNYREFDGEVCERCSHLI